MVDSSVNEDGNLSSLPDSGASADIQLRALKKELKLKDDRLNRITEHSVMMANYMDKLKGEVLLVLTVIASLSLL
jgi:hypothetical protein